MSALRHDLRKVNVCRYVMPLREGGSLPAIAEADDGFLYALKFRGAGQGIKTLVAEFLGGEIAREMGLKIPEIVLANLDAGFGRTEPDEEIQDLLKASTGLNIGLHYLSGAITFDPAAFAVEPWLASQIVWLDSFIMNVDRTARNANMLIWQKEIWLIDHGASFYFHHSWSNWKDYVTKPFVQVADHILLSNATKITDVDESMRKKLNHGFFNDLCNSIPDEFLNFPDLDLRPEQIREVYATFLIKRLENSNIFVNHANSIHGTII